MLFFPQFQRAAFQTRVERRQCGTAARRVRSEDGIRSVSIETASAAAKPSGFISKQTLSELTYSGGVLCLLAIGHTSR